MGIIKIFKRKECSVLTWQGWILVITLIFFLFEGFIRYISVFLSVNKPKGENILVLDGQMPDFSIREAINIFNAGAYDLVVTTGGQIQTGYFISEYKTMAELTASSFVQMGFDRGKVVAIPGGEFKRDRTYNSAMSLKEWIRDNNIDITKLDVVAVGSHARRSRLLFKKAFSGEIEIGIISVEDPAYNPNSWWKTSVGARTIISETIAYFYVLLFFKD